MHLKCTDLTETQYEFLRDSADLPFYCLVCKPRSIFADVIFDNTTLCINNDSTNTISNSSACSSDFEWVDDSDSESSRGLNFDSLPVHNNMNSLKNNTKTYITKPRGISLHTRSYKYPCVICLGPCRENCQDSICCTLCDEWTHQKCSDLTIDEFTKYCLPENAEVPFYCDICLYGSRRNLENQTCLKASEISVLDTNDIYNLCPNSIFRDKDDISTTEYFTSDELNFEIKKHLIIFALSI